MKKQNEEAEPRSEMRSKRARDVREQASKIRGIDKEDSKKHKNKTNEETQRRTNY
jgi:hypothetical protein